MTSRAAEDPPDAGSDSDTNSADNDSANNDNIGALPRTQSISRWDRIWRPFWVLPMIIVVAATVAGVFLPELDRSFNEQLPFVFPGGPSGARDLLGTIAGAMISVTGLVFSITMVVMQLASSQYSPRILGDFLSNRVTQTTLGIFAASFTYALTVLRSVQGESREGGAFVPQISVTVSFLLVLASVGMFLAFMHRITNSIQVSSIVAQVGDVTLDVLDRYLPELDAPGARLGTDSWDPDPGLTSQTVLAEEHGLIVEVDHREMVTWAVEHDAVVDVLLQVGAFVPQGAPALRIWRAAGSPVLEEEQLGSLRRRVMVDMDRAFNQDPAYGVRKLVDIAERALSPGINDPTTAVQVLDELHRILRLAVTRAELPALVTHEQVVRLVHRPQRVDLLIDLALAEPLHYGKDSLQIPPRITALIEDLLTVALPEHKPLLERWLAKAQTHAQTTTHATG